MTVQVPLKKSDSEAEHELEALIEEARERARRRRAAVAVSALVVGALLGLAYFVFGGGDDGSSSRSEGNGDDTPGVERGPGEHSRGYRCPTTTAELKRVLPGPGIPGCLISFHSDLPPGWTEGRNVADIFPPSTIGVLTPLSIHYENFEAKQRFTDSPFTDMPRSGASAVLFPQALASPGEQSDASPIELRPEDFREPARPGGASTLRADVIYGGRLYNVKVRAESSPVAPWLVEELNDILNSISTTERLCPCGKGSDDALRQILEKNPNYPEAPPR